MIQNKDDAVHLHPEEKEYRRKAEAIRKFYTIDVKPGDIIRYDAGKRKYFGLVVETKVTEEKPEYQVVAGKIHWSVDAPEDDSHSHWHQFNTNKWSVMNR